MDRRIKKTKKAIYDAYLCAKRKEPEVRPSVKEICAYADINKTTFYRYFTDVDDLSYSIVNEIIGYLLNGAVAVENLLTSPETYFGQVIKRYKLYEADFNLLFAENSQASIYEAEKFIKNKIAETTGNKYDDILLTFIAGGAVRFFTAENYSDQNNLIKFCRIIRAVVSAFDGA